MRADPEILEMIRRLPGFGELADAETGLLAKAATLRSFADGAAIFEEDDASTDFYYIVSGVVAIRNSIPSSGELWTEMLILRSGALFGALSFLDGARRNTAAYARERSMLLAFGGEAVKKACGSNAVLGRAVYATLGATAARNARDVAMELRTMIAEKR